MATTPEALEHVLGRDIASLVDLAAQDDSFSGELYRSLASVKWHHPQGSVALSWKRAEELINDARAEKDLPPLTLAQTGGEGEVSDRVASALEPLGWSPRPLDTSTHSSAHVDSRADAPPRDTEPPEWERQAHADAEAERRERLG